MSQIRALATENGVQYIERSMKPSPPAANNEVDVRNLLSSDSYFAYDSTYIGVLDTGVRYTHDLLQATLGVVLDCVTGTGVDCSGGTDPSDSFNHGTSMVSELTASNVFGNNDRGVTQNIVDSYRIFNGGVLSLPALARGYQAAVDWGDRLIVIDVQDTSAPTGTVSTISDAVYAANVAVVACAGNSGPAPDSVTAPGNSHYALTIGAVDVTSQALESYSGRGPTADGRTKPDLLGPTNVMAASNVSDTAMQMFGGTSAATPNIGGAAAMIRSFMKNPNSYDFFPGYLNAAMIGMGQNLTDPADDNNNGAGLVKCMTNGNYWYGLVTLQPSGTVNVPIPISGTISSVDGALWWPEASGQYFAVSLALLDPSNTVRATSTSSTSVFERARATTGLTTGTWTLQINATYVPTAHPVFYYAFKKN